MRQMEYKQIEITKGYSKKRFKEYMKVLMKHAGIKG